MDKIDLKPCPCCGGEAKLMKTHSKYMQSYSSINDSFCVFCTVCQLQTKDYESKVYISDNGEVIVDKNGAKDAASCWNWRKKQ